MVLSDGAALVTFLLDLGLVLLVTDLTADGDPEVVADPLAALPMTLPNDGGARTKSGCSRSEPGGSLAATRQRACDPRRLQCSCWERHSEADEPLKVLERAKTRLPAAQAVPWDMAMRGTQFDQMYQLGLQPTSRPPRLLVESHDSASSRCTTPSSRRHHRRGGGLGDERRI